MMLGHWLLCAIGLAAATATTTTSKPLSILVVESLGSPSHHLWAMTLVRALLRRGHHVHVVSIHEANIKGAFTRNLTSGVFNNLLDDIKTIDDGNYNPAEWETHSVLYSIYFLYKWSTFSCEKIVENEGAKKLLETVKNVEFDVIVQDVTLNQCLYGLWEVAKGRPAMVGFVPYGPAPWLKHYIGGPNYPSVRRYAGTDFADIPEGLWERTWNTFYYIVDDLIRQYYYLSICQRLVEQYVGHKIRPLHEIEKDISIVLINSHPSFDNAIPLPPNALEIGGMHAQIVQPIAGEVPVTYSEDIRKFLDEADNGFVVISLGTNVGWNSFKADTLKEIATALSKLKQRVLWKLDVEVSFQIPDNIMIVKWMPQDKILTHKNVKAIWTHGGLLSTQEAIWKGVPVIGMPFFYDQKSNVKTLVNKGAGIRLSVRNLSAQSVLNAMQDILYNESYTRNMKKLSSEFRDRVVPPLDLAIWGIEYAARNPQGSLASPIKFQSITERNLIDVYAVFFLSFVVILSILFFTLKILYKFYCNYVRTASKSKSKQS